MGITRKRIAMKQVFPDIKLEKFEAQPEKHVGWVWLVKMREGLEVAEDAWIAESPREAIAKAQSMYTEAKLVSCHRREEVTTYSEYLRLLDGRIL